ncbi:SGNH/GDSL hydrolase family protein [Arenibacter sp. F20364]|uniref:SGNH/GDSL hydrolase family protein n=1 Tax=Arenibacter sp. F20364 TaxID=2926415 RepID=UPI001FF6824F|nr:SGNH/GDSL hydrolase family protein [Arenibacter sp. F20364]MCK0188808.1 SGNH/GDSL hydrolase family protein [Arenibacter sp. F20364]
MRLSLLFVLAIVFTGCSQEGELTAIEPALDDILETELPSALDNELAGPYLNESGTYNYLALGDSYTIGASVTSAESFPIQLKDRLEQGLEVEVNTEIIAVTGWRTDNLLDGLNRGTLHASYNLVTLLIGVNNQYQGRPFRIYTKEFPQLLERAIELAYGNPKNVVVVSIPDYAYTPFASFGNTDKISKEINAYNAFAESTALQKGVPFLNITDITRNGLSNPELVAGDGLHPSGEAYKRFVDVIYPVVLPIFD